MTKASLSLSLSLSVSLSLSLSLSPSVSLSLSLSLCLSLSVGLSLQIESYIRESMKTEMAQLQQSAVHNHTAAMLEMGTNLLSQTAEQTRKLTDVETQVQGRPPDLRSDPCCVLHANVIVDPTLLLLLVGLSPDQALSSIARWSGGGCCHFLQHKRRDQRA